jgi:molecular chaperone DnaK (HSP70)
MSIRGPAIAMTALLLLSGCGKMAMSCARAVEHHPPSFNSGSVVREFHPTKPIEISPRLARDDLGQTSARDSRHDGELADKLTESGHKLTEEGVKKAIEEGTKHRDNDDKKQDANQGAPQRFDAFTERYLKDLIERQKNLPGGASPKYRKSVDFTEY